MIQCATQLNLEKYYSICLEERKALHYPPFSWLVRLEIQGQNKKAVENAIEIVSVSVKQIIKLKLGFGFGFENKW